MNTMYDFCSVPAPSVPIVINFCDSRQAGELKITSACTRHVHFQNSSTMRVSQTLHTTHVEIDGSPREPESLNMLMIDIFHRPNPADTCGQRA
jgi:hypothetical protein